MVNKQEQGVHCNVKSFEDFGMLVAAKGKEKYCGIGGQFCTTNKKCKGTCLLKDLIL